MKIKVAAEPFKRIRNADWKPTPDMFDTKSFKIEIVPPSGEITIEGTRRNCRMLIEYVEGKNSYFYNTSRNELLS